MLAINAQQLTSHVWLHAVKSVNGASLIKSGCSMDGYFQKMRYATKQISLWKQQSFEDIFFKVCRFLVLFRLLPMKLIKDYYFT